MLHAHSLGILVTCPWCGRTVESGRQFCCGYFLPNASTPIDRNAVAEFPSKGIAEYALASDLALGKAVADIPILSSVARTVIAKWQSPIERARLLGDGVRITPKQVPSLYSRLAVAAERIGVSCPELFIKQDPTLNAYTVGTNKDHLIVVHSGLFDAAEPDELQFILGHELGHIRNHHVTNMTIARSLAQGFATIAGVLLLPLTAALDAWSREAEKTADRSGFIATASPDASLRALLLLAVGSRKLLSEITLSEYLVQRQGLNTAQAKIDLWFGGHDHPHLVERAHALVEFIVGPIGSRYFEQIASKPKQLTGNAQAGSAPGRDEKKRLESGDNQNRFCSVCGFELPESSRICTTCASLVS